MHQENIKMQSESESLMLRAELYAERRAEVLAEERLEEYLRQPGVRSQLGDPGVENDLYASHDFETNTEQKAPGVTTDQYSASIPLEIDDEQF
jgi:hypothetical protein